METSRKISLEISSLKNYKKLLSLIFVLALASFLITYIFVSREEERKAEEKSKTEIVFKYFVEEN